MVNYSISNYIYGKQYKNEQDIKCKIIDIKGQDDYIKLTCIYKIYKIFVYIDNDNIKYECGDIIEVNGVIKQIESNTIENGFNYKEYLKYEKILFVINSKNIKIIKNEFSIYRIRSMFINYINNFFNDKNSLLIIKGLVMGNTDEFDNQFKENLKTNGIIHLFAVSGLHVSLLIIMVKKILEIFKINENRSEKIIIIFLVLYLIITSFSESIIRASLMYFLSVINKNKFKNVFSSLDVCSISFILCVIVNPFFAFRIGFVLSYLVCFSIILFSGLVKNRNKYVQILLISMMSNLITLPIIVNINYEINLLSPIMNVIYISMVSSLILPFTFIVLIFPIFSFIYKYVVYLFIEMINITSLFNLRVNFPHLNSLVIIIFILLLLSIIRLYNKKKYRNIFICLFLVFLFILSNISLLNCSFSIDCLYLHDGEAILIRNKKYSILIDSGDGVNDEVYSFLKSKGINRLDYFFITHCHDDHNGGVEKIINNINVNNLGISEYDNSDYKEYSNTRILNKEDVIKIFDMEFIILHPYCNNMNENDNSLVILLKTKYSNILFMGDLSIKYEKEIAEYIISNKIRVDLIKIGHHGSDTSTSDLFISKLKPSYALIMVGKKWKDTFPCDSVIGILKKYNVNIIDTLTYYSYKLVFRNKNIYFSSVH